MLSKHLSNGWISGHTDGRMIRFLTAQRDGQQDGEMGSRTKVLGLCKRLATAAPADTATRAWALGKRERSLLALVSRITRSRKGQQDRHRWRQPVPPTAVPTPAGDAGWPLRHTQSTVRRASLSDGLSVQYCLGNRGSAGFRAGGARFRSRSASPRRSAVASLPPGGSPQPLLAPGSNWRTRPGSFSGR